MRPADNNAGIAQNSQMLGQVGLGYSHDFLQIPLFDLALHLPERRHDPKPVPIGQSFEKIDLQIQNIVLFFQVRLKGFHDRRLQMLHGCAF